MSHTPRWLRRLVVALALSALLPGAVSAAGDGRPAPPAGGHDVTRPWITSQVSDEISSAKVGPLQPRGSVNPIRPRPAAGAATPRAAAGTSPTLNREVMGFARAGSLDDASVGFRAWNFALLTDVAYFGIHVNAEGTLVQNDSGWSIWQSATASNLINTAHAAGVRVLLTLMFLPSASQNGTTCQALDNGQTTITEAAAQLKGADGIDIDYEGSNATCPDNVPLRTKLTQFVQKVRASNLGYLVVDTYASSAEDSGGFFDIPTLAGSVDALFVMAYSLESSNGPCALCMSPTSPLAGASPNYTWNVTRAANGYAPWAGQVIMGLPYYGVAGCVQGPNPPANAPVVSPSHYSGVPYTAFAGLPTDSSVSSLSMHRDALDPTGQEVWATYFDSDPTLNCWREAYWDDQVSLTEKYDLVNQRNFRGAGLFTLDYGGGSPELWNALALNFGSAPTLKSLGGGTLSSPAVASWGPNRLDVFIRGLDNALWHDGWNGTSWAGWERLGGILTSAPAAVSWGTGRIDVFARGSDAALWHIAWTGASWSPWQSLGGGMIDGPAVASWGPSRLDVFVRGLGNGLYHLGWNGAVWSPWEGHVAVLTAGPGAVSWGPSRIDVFVRGSDSALWHIAWDGAAWTAWEPHGGGLTAFAPAPASKAPGLLDVYIPGLDAGLWHTIWNGSGWSGFAAVGPANVWRMGPATVSQRGTGHIDVFAVGPDGAIWHALI